MTEPVSDGQEENQAMCDNPEERKEEKKTADSTSSQAVDTEYNQFCQKRIMELINEQPEL